MSDIVNCTFCIAYEDDANPSYLCRSTLPQFHYVDPSPPVSNQSKPTRSDHCRYMYISSRVSVSCPGIRTYTSDLELPARPGAAR